MNTLTSGIENTGNGATAALQAVNQLIAALNELKVKAEINIVGYDLGNLYRQ